MAKLEGKDLYINEGKRVWVKVECSEKEGTRKERRVGRSIGEEEKCVEGKGAVPVYKERRMLLEVGSHAPVLGAKVIILTWA